MWDQWRTVWFAIWFLFSLMFWRLLNINYCSENPTGFLHGRNSIFARDIIHLNLSTRSWWQIFNNRVHEKDKNIWTLKFSHCLYLNVMYLLQKSNSCLLLLKWFFSYLTYWIVICNSWKHTRLMWIEAQVHTEIAAAFWCSL